MEDRDCFEKIQSKKKVLDFLFLKLKETTVLILWQYRWIMEDVDLYESFCHLQEMIEESEKKIGHFEEYLALLEKKSVDFFPTDLEDEFDYLSETVTLELSYLGNFIDTMFLLSIVEFEGTTKKEEVELALMETMDKDTLCYNQVKINNQEIKKMQKERKDIFE